MVAVPPAVTLAEKLTLVSEPYVTVLGVAVNVVTVAVSELTVRFWVGVELELVKLVSPP
jgi:hypothetical protein